MSGGRDEIPWSWWIGALIAVATIGVVIHLAMRSGYEPGGAEDDAMREAMEEIGQALREAGHVDLADLPSDLATLDERRYTAYLFRAFEDCGQVDLSAFEGEYRAPGGGGDWADPRIFDGRIQAGGLLRMELCPVHVVERDRDRVLSLAVWHEDVHDPGDASLTYLEIRRADGAVAIRFDTDQRALAEQTAVILRR